ncbi:MAG TPA: DUF6701 domain-containing protein, partial [Arenimonas sp.]|nr:DUF6701 domain-containing protein [Arenimonas sp.]
ATGADTLSYTFASPETVPTVISIRARESSGSDNVTSAGSASYEASTSIRSGRLRLINAFGSGQTALSLPLRLETWQTISGTTTDAWITETGDTCSAALLAPDAFSSDWTGSGSGTSIDTVTLYQSPDPNPGTGNLLLTAPGSAGTAEITAELDDVAEWLRFDWDGDGDSDDPRARVGFELNPGNRKQIYTREVIGN